MLQVISVRRSISMIKFIRSLRNKHRGFLPRGRACGLLQCQILSPRSQRAPSRTPRQPVPPEHHPATTRAPLAAAAKGLHRYQRELFDDGHRDPASGARTCLRPDRIMPRHYATGNLRRGVPRRCLARHIRQRRAVHLRRGGEDRVGDSQDPWRAHRADRRAPRV